MTDKGSDAQPKKSSAGKIVVPALVLGAFILGYWLSGGGRSDTAHVENPGGGAHAEAEKNPAAATQWTCSMHPQIKLPKMGKCPICFMDLIPLVSNDDDDAANPRRISMSKAAKLLAEVQTAEVKRARAKVKRRLVGMVFENETTVAALTSRVNGRLDEIHVDFTGVQVNKGDPMVTIWSPTLITTQVELFETMRSGEFDASVARGAEEKLEQYGLTKEQIKEIKEKRKPILYTTLRAPINGVVLKKNALLGHFVKEGTEMFIISDLSTVWIKLDAYESDLPWIRYGQKVTFTTPSAPGRVFKGKVLFIDPVLQMNTRSVKVRVEAENPDLILKPHMFVTAEVESEVDSKGHVINLDWAGKAVCPVHPDVVGKVGDSCSKSKMQLRQAAHYGYTADENHELPLVIPSTSVLFTGKRSIVYIEVPDRDKPTYELKEIVLGPRAGDQYVVYQGLKEGDKVVAYGNFKIDSAMQIMAKSSMMNPMEVLDSKPEAPEEEVLEKVKAPAQFLADLTPMAKDYLGLKEALVEEKAADAATFAKGLAEKIKAARTDILDKAVRDKWSELASTMTTALAGLSKSSDVETQRKLFGPVSEAFARVVLTFRHTMDQTLVLFHCPMALNNDGAYWVEGSKNLRNPYYGHKMLKCGELIEEIPPEKIALKAGAESGPAKEDVSATKADTKEKESATSAKSAGAPGESKADGKTGGTEAKADKGVK